MKRREIIQYMVAGVTVSILASGKRAKALGHPIEYFRGLQSVVGASQISNSVSQYLRGELRGTPVAAAVQKVNNVMTQDNFSDYSQSNVFGSRRYFFYAVINDDQFNICVPFFAPSASNPGGNITMVEGPTVMGLGLAADEIALEASPQLARQLVLPVENVSRAMGGFQKPYNQPDIFRTSNGGETTVNYDTTGPGTGSVAVTHRSGEGLTYDRKFDIEYIA